MRSPEDELHIERVIKPLLRTKGLTPSYMYCLTAILDFVVRSTELHDENKPHQARACLNQAQEKATELANTAKATALDTSLESTAKATELRAGIYNLAVNLQGILQKMIAKSIST